MATRVEARQQAGEPFDWRSLAVAGLASAALGASVGTGRWEYMLAVLALGGLYVGLRNWRWSVWGLIFFLPFSGIPILAFHDDGLAGWSQGVPTLTKDLVFVIPAYVGLIWSCVRAGRSPWDPALGRWPLLLAAALSAWVLLEVLNPDTPSLLVAAIGVKVWLLYLPMYVVGFHFVRDREDLRQFLRYGTLVAVVPAVVGLVSALLLYTGLGEIVYTIYGDAAFAATQGFVELDFNQGGTGLRRVPSTFSFYTQYFCFLMAMITLAWAWWRSGGSARGLRSPALVALVTLIAAAFLSGSRNAYLGVPMVLGLAFVFESRRTRRLHVSAAALAAGLATTAVLLALGLIQEAVELVSYNLEQAVLDPLSEIVEDSVLLGNGTGINTVSARYGDSGLTDAYYDSWYLKALVELGVLGLVLALALFGSLLARLADAFGRARDAELLPVLAALLAFGIWVVVNNIKGFYLDLDPINVYLWFFLGIGAKVALLDREAAR